MVVFDFVQPYDTLNTLKLELECGAVEIAFNLSIRQNYFDLFRNGKFVLFVSPILKVSSFWLVRT